MHATRLFTILLASFLFSASTDSLTAQTITHVSRYTFSGNNIGDQFGISVSGAGDVNGDGFADLIVGATEGSGSGRGRARVLSGSDGSVLYNFFGNRTLDDFGASVDAAGDVNGDGTPDLIVGAKHEDNNGSNSGSARVFSGSDSSVLYTFNGDSTWDQFGTSVSGAGDVNGDGFADLIVGAPGDDNNGGASGSAHVLSGSDGNVLYTFDGDTVGDEFGGSVSSAGDVNGDGFADLIVGTFRDDNNGQDSGNARVLSGSDGSVLFNFNGDSLFDEFGFSVSGAGDVNGDGMDDLIVGAPNRLGFSSSSVRVLSGSNGSVLYRFDGNVNDEFGFSVSGAGDVNGDGFADLIVGAPGDNNRGSNSGSARVLSGSDGSVLYNFDGNSVGDKFGTSVSGAGDVNGDGIDDFIVGAPFGGSSGYARVYVSQISAPACVLGDVDLSGTVDFLDIAPFIAVLSNATNQCEADCDQSGMVDFLDIAPFIAILSGS